MAKKFYLSFGQDPLLWAKCKTEMTLSDIVYPGIGSILELIYKKEYEKMQEEEYVLQKDHDIIKGKMGYEAFYV